MFAIKPRRFVVKLLDFECWAYGSEHHYQFATKIVGRSKNKLTNEVLYFLLFDTKFTSNPQFKGVLWVETN